MPEKTLAKYKTYTLMYEQGLHNRTTVRVINHNDEPMQHKKTKLGQCVMRAKENDLSISIVRFAPKQNKFMVEIEQPLGSGYGIAYLKVNRSHRSMDRLRIIGASGFYPTTLRCTSYNFHVPNTLDMIEKCLSVHGVSIVKRKTPKALFYVDYGEVTERNYF